ncbi:MAG: hypothetical protein CL610_02975 [Anaerolineaceae bacterium]|nr:hypothetical protein [Anaerolineaceae bacterium]
MRQFEILDQMTTDEQSGMVTLSKQDDANQHPQMALRREGVYIAISARFGPTEIALRPHFEDFVRLLRRLQPVEGLQTTRQVGTSQAYLAIGLRTDGTLVVRPTIAADATGYFTINLALSPDVRQALFDWLNVEQDA